MLTVDEVVLITVDEVVLEANEVALIVGEVVLKANEVVLIADEVDKLEDEVVVDETVELAVGVVSGAQTSASQPPHFKASATVSRYDTLSKSTFSEA